MIVMIIISNYQLIQSYERVYHFRILKKFVCLHLVLIKKQVKHYFKLVSFLCSFQYFVIECTLIETLKIITHVQMAVCHQLS